jgi:cell division protease FtsH
MADDKKQDFKKGLSNNLVFLLMAAILLIFMVQTFLETKSAKVSFSYQLEHLVNLGLIQPEESHKIALNDNLVTFSGKFRDRLSDESKGRYKYLELLNENHELQNQKQQIEGDLSLLKGKILDAADWYLHLSGLPLPAGGYIVIDDINSPEHSVVVTELSKKNVESVRDVATALAAAKASPNAEGIAQVGKSVGGLVRNLRSPVLGIGSEVIKQQLRGIETSLNEANNANTAPEKRLAIYESSLKSIEAILVDLNQVEDHMRLSKLRSVRAYNEATDGFQALLTSLDDNTVQLDKARQAVSHVIWFYNNQELSTRGLEKQDPEAFNQWFINAKEEWQSFSHNVGGFFKAPDQPLNTVLEKTFKSEPPAPNYMSYLFTMLPVLLILMVLYFVFSRQMKGMGNNAMSFGKSPARLLIKGSNKTTFKDVAGADEAIEELQEIVEFLKNPQKFTSLGGRIPKGVLCVGPPGTGKTLIARAVAGEADRPFFSISGSDFVEMFVGVGASRIRDMFNEAKKNAPCIVFIDEIDAVGRSRGVGIGGGNDEREQTLNQLLVEMDGFDTGEGVILMAATNRPDVLDKALLRPGRFDRRVVISLPDIKGRFDILKVHARKIKMDASVDLMAVARGTPGCSGADLANILNEAALAAARKGRAAVTAQETVEARDKVLYGKERRSLEMDENEKKTTAYHEAGHTIVGLIVKHGDPIDKVTIIPRGMSLGSTMFLPTKNRVSYWKNELHDRLAVLMGGRVAEEEFVGDVSSGAQQDIERATNLARAMVCEWGMSDKLGTVAYDQRSEAGQYLGMNGYHEKQYSEETAKAIDHEVREILESAIQAARDIIKKYAPQLELMTQMLIEFETLDNEDIKEILANEWSIQKKKDRMKKADELHKKTAATPPPPPTFNDDRSVTAPVPA